MHTDLLLLLID